MLNLTQYLEDEYKKSVTTVFLDLSAAYGTVNHRLLLTKLYAMSQDAEFTKLIGSMMSNLCFSILLFVGYCVLRFIVEITSKIYLL